MAQSDNAGPPPGPAGLPALIQDVLQAGLRLVRGEIALAKAEAEMAAGLALRALVLGLIALVLMLFGLSQAVSALHFWLIWLGFGPAVASLMLTGGFFLLAALLFWLALRKLQLARLAAPRLPGLSAGRRAAHMSHEEDER